MSLNRLQWLISEVHKGRSVFVTFSHNQVTQREKVKFVLDDAYSTATVYRPCVMAALSAVRVAVSSSIVTDKGHKSKSDNRTVMEFWIQQPQSDDGTNTMDIYPPTGDMGVGLPLPQQSDDSIQEGDLDHVSGTAH